VTDERKPISVTPTVPAVPPPKVVIVWQGRTYEFASESEALKKGFHLG